jgi:NO-binding membrane sensor protein with MHYT domain/two-component sensor histidine kinase
LVGTYNYWLVLLSLVVAITASYDALDLTSRVVACQGQTSERFWLIGGAVAMGCGIWSMHFVGMLSFRAPVRVSYDAQITGLSLLIAVAASWFALYVASRPTLSLSRLFGGGLLMGLAIAAMHYTGMAAMRVAQPVHYNAAMVALSVAIAISASLVALWSGFQLRLETIFTSIWKKAGSAAVMGAGICAMHYTGMAASMFTPISISTVTAPSVSQAGLAAALSGFTLAFLIAMLLVSALDAYYAERSAKLAERALRDSEQQLRRLFDEREHLVRDLHDNTVQSIYAAGMNLEEIKRLIQKDPARAAAEVAMAVAHLNGVIRDIRGYIDGSAEQTRAILRDDLAKLAELSRSISNPRFELKIDAAAAGHLTPDEAEQLLQIAREAMSNSRRHSRAKHGTIALCLTNEGVMLEISDDGAGFDPAGPRHEGSGLYNMKARAQQIGARLEILAALGKGTRIVLNIPMRRVSQ